VEEGAEGELELDHREQQQQVQLPPQKQAVKAKQEACSPSRANNDFYELVLLPRGVIDGRAASMLASAHFSTTIPKGGRKAYYQEGGDASRVWLEKDEAFINNVIGDYDWMTTHTIPVRQGDANPEETRHWSRDQRLWITHRMVELVTKPKTVDNIKAPPRNPTPWWSPPLLDPSQPHKEYSYDIRPGCQY
jgi:hypothetical protein